MTEQEVRAVVEQLLSRLNAGELAMPAAQVPTPARIPEQTPEQDGQQTAEGQTGTGTTGESELSTDVLPQDEPFV